MAHKHWPEGDPAYELAPTCRFRTKRECDEDYTQFVHGHWGRPCIKQQQESKSKRGRMNKLATCVIINHPETGESFAQNLRRQSAARYNEEAPVDAGA